MTTSTKKQAINRKARFPLPDSVGHAVIDGKEFLLIPTDDFSEWSEDQILNAVANERLKNKPRTTVSAEEVFARQDAKRAKEK